MRQLRSWLYQGDISDLNVLSSTLGDFYRDGPTVARKYGITLALHVGSTPFVPRGIPTVYFPMSDSEGAEDNDWDTLRNILGFVRDAVCRRNGRILITCDAGLSRSAVVSAMLVSIIEQRPMNDDLLADLREKNPALDPLPGLWKNADNALVTWWLG